MKTHNWRLDYEKQTYSQHGEDGIIKVMTDAIRQPNKFVFEIGWGSGKENMSRNLFEQGWSGIGIDGARQPHPGLIIPDQFQYRCFYVQPDRLSEAFQDVPHDMDFFSLDIDSFDYEVASWALANGYRPKTVCLEFNCHFGPYVQASFPWAPLTLDRPKHVYNKKIFYGCSLARYRQLWEGHGYRWFGFDSSCVNTFFYDPDQVNDLTHWQTLVESDLRYQHDQVQAAIESHPYWIQRRADIYGGPAA